MDKFEDAKNAYDRRGAAFTFDGVEFSKFVVSLRDASSSEDIVNDVLNDGRDDSAALEPGHLGTGRGVIYAPGFSHTLKDPTPGAIAVHPHHKIVIIEGLYTFLGIDPWHVASLALDERWFVDVDLIVARERLIRRHVVTGVAKDLIEAEWRADNNDIPSEHVPFIFPSFGVLTRTPVSFADGGFIRKFMLPPTYIIKSVDDPAMISRGRIE